MATQYLPFTTSLPERLAYAVCSILRTCVACNAMCMQPGPPGHVRYQHTHQVQDQLICIVVVLESQGRGPSHPYYMILTTSVGTLETRGVRVPAGHFPVTDSTSVAEAGRRVHWADTPPTISHT
ncbi:hypothetical protein OH77DRAFT_1432421 [Trametes cingulata]|nr:hypothetical protein OH77DRAFT_1432421 [Trametes cingulata]